MRKGGTERRSIAKRHNALCARIEVIVVARTFCGSDSALFEPRARAGSRDAARAAAVKSLLEKVP